MPQPPRVVSCEENLGVANSTRRVLLVDDDDDALLLLKRDLSPLVGCVDAVKTCAEAVLLMSKNHYDLAVVDFILSGDYWSGIEMCNYAERSGTQAVLVSSEPAISQILGARRPVFQKTMRAVDILRNLHRSPPAIEVSSTASTLLRRVKIQCSG